MKKNIFILIAAITVLFSSCGDDFLSYNPREQIAAGAPATEGVIMQNLTGAYQIFLFDNYANGTLGSVVLFGDFRSDDIYKGGSDITDQSEFHQLAQFTSTPTEVPSGWWSIFYTGLKRCNGTLDACDNAVESVNPAVVARVRAETLAMRAYYVHWLWKTWGNIPYFDKVWTQEPFLAKQYSFDELYPILIADLDAAINTPELPMSVSGAEMGRITKAFAMMTKARVVMYKNDQSKYAEVLEDMKSIINSGAYSLVKTAKQPNFTGLISKDPRVTAPSTTNPIEWIFLQDGEFCSESIFESNNTSTGKTWGGSWTGFGNYDPTVISPRALTDDVFATGWGWATVRKDAFAETFNEDGDYRREASVSNWSSQTGTMPTTADGPGWQNTGLYLRKYAARKGYNEIVGGGDGPLNFENNERIFRLAEAYLNAAELAFATSGQGAAQPFLDAIRERAFGDATHSIPATLNNIKLERRREFFGEGQRFWDLVRWGSDENGTPIEQVLSEVDPVYSMNRTYTADKRFLPIQKNELDKTAGTEFELVQNPGYEQ